MNRIASLFLAALYVNALPLGDGKYTLTGPRKGYVFVCRVMSGGRGTRGDVSWIHGATWDPAAKPVVPGDVKWPDAYVRVMVSGGRVFPHSYSIELPAHPALASSPNCISGIAGIMNDGVWLFDAFDALYRDAPAHELMDGCQGHPNPLGYHHHSLSSCYPRATVETVVGWAFDGFPITGAATPGGKTLTTAGLDECHGMTSDVLVDGKPTRTYHYVLTEDFPYSVSCFKGRSYEPHPRIGR